MLVVPEDLEDGERHGRVIGPFPEVRVGKSSLGDQRVDLFWRPEESLAEGVTKREPLEREACAVEGLECVC